MTERSTGLLESPIGLGEAHSATKFTSLYAELLSHISEYLSAFDVARLWLCGSLALQRTLARNGVDTWRFQVGSRFERLAWPSILMRTLQAPNVIVALPSRLIPPIIGAIISSMSLTTRRFQLLSTFDGLPPSSSYGVISNFSRFTCLLELSLGFEVVISASEELNQLPASLRKLCAVAAFETLDSRSLSLPNLEELCLRFTVGECYLKLDKLQTLTSLTLIAPGQLTWTTLPNSLQLLSYSQSMSSDLIRELPSGLTSLTTRIFGRDAMSTALALPRTLIELNLTSSSTSKSLMPNDFLSALPRTLIRLDLRNMMLDSRSSHHLPPSLVKLSLEFSSHHLDKTAEIKLPSTVECIVQRGAPIPIANPLPPKLRSLTCPMLNINSSVHIDWPESLATLKTAINESRDMRGPPKGGRFQLSIEDLLERHFADIDESLRVPASLTHLDVHFLRGSLLTALMAPGLLFLKLRTDRSAIDSTFLPRWSKVLPTTLTDLDVEGVTVDEQWLDNMDLPQLRFLRLGQLSVPGGCLTELPTSLETLDIDELPNFQWNVDLRKYRHLRYLRIATKNSRPTMELASLLPSSLEKLSLSASEDVPVLDMLGDLRLEIDPEGARFPQAKLGPTAINLTSDTHWQSSTDLT